MDLRYFKTASNATFAAGYLIHTIYPFKKAERDAYGGKLRTNSKRNTGLAA